METLFETLYILSLSLQISGAIILIIRYWSKPINEQIKALDLRRERMVNDTLIMGSPLPSNNEFEKEIKLNRIAFIYIAAGYILSIWGQSIHKVIEACFIIFVSIILVFIGLKLAARR